MGPMWLFYSGRRLVIRDVYIFRRLTGSQQTPGFWGVTVMLDRGGRELHHWS